MAAFSTIIAVGALGVAAGSSAIAAKNAKKQAKAQNEALNYQRQQNNLAAARQKRDAIRMARIARANAVNAGATQGVLDSSGSQGGVGSIGSQLTGNLSFLDQWNTYSDQASQALGRANTYGQRAQLAQTIGNSAMTAFANADYLGAGLDKIFGRNTGTAAVG